MVFYTLVCCIFLWHCTAHTLDATKQKPNKVAEIEALLSNIYAQSTSYIPKEDASLIEKKGGNATYGEILPESLHHILSDMMITKKDVLYDLGSGMGKVVIQSYLTFPFQKVVGIELAAKRHRQATQALHYLDTHGYVDKKRTISFIKGDIIETPYKDATIIYMCSTCFSDALMEKIAEKCSHLKKGLRIITLKLIPNPSKYKLLLTKEYRLAMTWSKSFGSPVYVYKKIA